MTYYDTTLMNDADDLLSEADQVFGNGRACRTKTCCPTTTCATQKLLMSFALEQGELQLHL